ncbi:MAG: DNA mismatch endonuclease Vsr [Proteobacteria bacterium]|nr:DNA mismatch endonuclease Vsr [Pseudomonadota bacterium]
MTDIVDRKTRSRMMSGIKGKDTKPELIIRGALFARGFRYRLHDKRLPGKPDIVLPKYHAVIFVHGCFWHGHGCHLFKWPGTRGEFWRKKVTDNRSRDSRVIRQLLGNGWRVLTVWECSLKGKGCSGTDVIAGKIRRWLASKKARMEIAGKVLRSLGNK